MARTGGPPERKNLSIAVLPLRNLAGDARQDWLAQALTEELDAALLRTGAVVVTSGITARRYKGSDRTAAEVARELGNVGWLLDGSLRYENGTVRLDLALHDLASGRSIWRNYYEQPLGASLRLLDEIARLVALQTGGRIEGPTSGSPLPAVNGDAYESYLLGLHHRDRVMDGGCVNAEPYFLRSITLDSKFAQPHAVLGYCYGANRLDGTLSVAEGVSKGKAQITRALELDERLADAHVSLALIRHRTEYDWAGAERSFISALSLQPSHPEALVRYGELLYLSGRTEEGLSLLRRGVALAPFSVDYRVIFGYAYYHLRRLDESIEQFRMARELEPGRAYGSWGLAQSHALGGRHDQAAAEYVDALRLMLVSSRVEPATRLLRSAYDRAGWQGFWREELKLAAEDQRRPGTVWQAQFVRRKVNYEMARRLARLGEIDRTLVSLESAFEGREGNLVCLNVEPLFDSLRAHPRFKALVRRVGLEPR